MPSLHWLAFFTLHIICCLAAPPKGISETCNTSIFPSNFKFGAGSSAYQVEGAWNADGKGLNVFDWFYNTFNITNGNTADDSYYKYKDDIAAVKSMGLDYYRFSISWTRILPKGLSRQINQAGIDHYNALIDELKAAGIEPLVTIFHWDTPMALENLGIYWSNPTIIQYYTEYADLIFELFGDRVKLWATVNEPFTYCQRLTTDYQAYYPAIPMGTLEYLCAHNMLLAHASAYRLYERKYKQKQKGRVSITIDFEMSLPLTNSTEDQEAAERAIQFQFGWLANPIVYGDYPEILKKVIANNSRKQNLTTSRLPKFTEAEKILLKGSYDLFLINHYTTSLVTMAPYNNTPSFLNDQQIISSYAPDWPQTINGFDVYPPGIRDVLKYIKKHYKNPEIIITENGYSNTGGVNDTDRIQYIRDFLQQVRLAMCEDNVNVSAYVYWSLLDSFEWSSGYKPKFGLVQVDFNSSARTRTLKQSSTYYKNLIKTHYINASST